ncbi:unnamed protein product [Oikopleura dioica]|uniref:Claudin n=1 Tax=Oikopleura dioica TaxID=34765 RepID=E4YJ43_OIKDI|nr:unnamed protein product [Oikopleura dioica]
MAYYREYDKIYTKEAEGIHYLNFWMVIISWIFHITMILLPRFAWFNPDQGSGIFGEFNAMKGLFWECGTVSDMNFLCYNIADSMFNIPTALLILQFMVCLAFVLLTIVIVLAFLGMEWSRAYEHDIEKKINIMRLCGALMIIIGILTFGTVMWYGITIEREFRFPNMPDNILTVHTDVVRYEYGACVYLGFALSLIDFICAFIFIKYPGSIEYEDEVESRIYEEKNDMPSYTVPALEYAAPTYNTRRFDKDDFREPADLKLGNLTSPKSTKSRFKSRNSRRSQPGSIISKAPDFV